MIWLRWSWRDLRSRWMQVVAIAVVIAFGTGIFSGLRSMNIWRGLTNEASYAAANTFDLRVQLGTGSFVERGELLDMLDGIAAQYVADSEERLILPTQVSVQTDDGLVIVPGRLIGIDLGGGPDINMLHTEQGRALSSEDVGRSVVALEHNFAKYYGLPPHGNAVLSGGVPIEYVGQVLAPEYFFVITPEGGLLGQANFAAVFTSIETAQQISGAANAVNDLVLTLRPGADEDALVGAIEAEFSGIGGTVMRRLDDRSIRAVVEDVEGDRQFNTILAIFIFGGAVFAAFNLTSRIMDSQRREIGIAMALGVPTTRVALRPLLFSAQIALLGVVFGILMGIGVAALMRSVLAGLLPMPIWLTPFQFGVFAVAGILGFLIPFAATMIPVWRAVRVPPIDAIKTGHLAARSGGLPWLLSRLRVPGKTVRQVPFRNVARAPRRTLMTALGISAIVSILVVMMGMFDSFLAVFAEGDSEAAGANPDRVEVSLDSFYPADSPVVAGVVDSPFTGRAEPGLRLGGSLANGDTSFDVFIQFIDLDGDLWQPTVEDGSLHASAPAVLISKTAADDLDAEIGDTVALGHPKAGGPSLFTIGGSTLPVVGIHGNPFRTFVYMDVGHSGIIGVDGLTNVVYTEPAPGVDLDTLKRELFGLPGVVSVQLSTAAQEVFRDQFVQYTTILMFIQVAIMILALLIAYNTASINMDERQREHATMFAYGLPVRSVLGMAVTESVILGLISTALGLVGGYLMLQWVVMVLTPNVMPDLGVEALITPVSLITAVVLGVGAVAVAPLLTVRRLRKMDVPSTLRVME